MKTITTEQLRQLLHMNRPLVLDVREPWEFEEGHIEGALNIPTSEFVERFREVPKDENVFIICEHAVRSKQVYHFLEEMGYEKIVDVAGGMSEWGGAICL